MKKCIHLRLSKGLGGWILVPCYARYSPEGPGDGVRPGGMGVDQAAVWAAKRRKEQGMKDPNEFAGIEVISADDLVMVDLSWEGEGQDGDYDPHSGKDLPLLRYTLYRRHNSQDDPDKVAQLCHGDAFEEGDWMEVRDGSYCTRLYVWEERHWLYRAAKFILAHVETGLREYRHEKRLYETLSWVECRDGDIRCRMDLPGNLVLAPVPDRAYGILNDPDSWRLVKLSDLRLRGLSEVTWLRFGSGELHKSTLDEWQKWAKEIEAYPIYPNRAVMFQMPRVT